MKPIRVLTQINWLAYGGIETWLIDVLSRIDRSRFQIDIICKGASTGEMTALAEGYGAQVFHIPLKFNPWKFQSDLCSLLREGDYDIFHSHGGIMGYDSMAAAYKAGVRHKILSFHSTQVGGMYWADRQSITNVFKKAVLFRNKRGLKKILKNDDCLVWFFSKSMRDSLAKKLSIDFSNSELVAYGIDIHQGESPSHNYFKKEMGLDEKVLTLVHVGRFSASNQKNHDLLVLTASALKGKIDNFKFILIGDGERRQEIQKMVTEKNLEQYFIFTGTRDDVRDLLPEMDIFVFPSFFEGLSVALVEAQAAGLPVLASNIPENKEGLWEGMWKYSYHPQDHQKLAEAIIELGASPELRERLGKESRDFIVRNFARSACIEKMLTRYEELCN